MAWQSKELAKSAPGPLKLKQVLKSFYQSILMVLDFGDVKLTSRESRAGGLLIW